ncbi:hypothetical protein GGR57DRAFT_503681 [Xylariaceae sp. FL1272]|nr:hypothetical protein GGR57DRAFT_503681 [Xylariaceae sp. FL1272]
MEAQTTVKQVDLTWPISAFAAVWHNRDTTKAILRASAKILNREHPELSILLTSLAQRGGRVICTGHHFHGSMRLGFYPWVTTVWKLPWTPACYTRADPIPQSSHIGPDDKTDWGAGLPDVHNVMGNVITGVAPEDCVYDVYERAIQKYPLYSSTDNGSIYRELAPSRHRVNSTYDTSIHKPNGGNVTTHA